MQINFNEIYTDQAGFKYVPIVQGERENDKKPVVVLKKYCTNNILDILDVDLFVVPDDSNCLEDLINTQLSFDLQFYDQHYPPVVRISNHLFSHYKGNKYFVNFTAFDLERNEAVYLYFNPQQPNITWCRGVKDFYTQVEERAKTRFLILG